jgi:hypothetical protein
MSWLLPRMYPPYALGLLQANMRPASTSGLSDGSPKPIVGKSLLLICLSADHLTPQSYYCKQPVSPSWLQSLSHLGATASSPDPITIRGFGGHGQAPPVTCVPLPLCHPFKTLAC